MNTVTLCENTLDPSTWTTHENVKDVRDFLVDHFGIWPETARIYLEHVSDRTDITPFDQAGIERLGRAQGNFYVVVYPQGIELIFVIIAVAIAAVAIALVFLFRPSRKGQNEESPNNRLSDRKNEARPNERIPDIFGQVWATFDLLAFPYRTFVNNIEIEHNFMCIGRGEYDLLDTDIRDDITPLVQVAGAQVEVYGPNNNPNNSGTPFITIGPPINELVINIQPFGSVNGQVLRAPNKGSWVAGVWKWGQLRFVSPNIIENNGGDFTTIFAVNDEITIGGLDWVGVDDLAIDPAHIQPSVHLGGQYFATAVSASQITLSAPALVNANWSALAAFAGGVSEWINDNLVANGSVAAGPFIILNAAMTEFWCNFVALQGCYLVDAEGVQHEVDVQIEISVTQCNAAGAPINLMKFYFATVIGSKVDRQQKGTTLKILIGAKLPGFAGIIVTARRNSWTDLAANHTVSDEIQWRDAYIVSPVGNVDFGNITSVQSLIRPTPQALAIKERKQNALVTRKVPSWTGSAWGATAPTKNAALILCAMAFDPFIGNRIASEVDHLQILATAGTGGTIETYFGSSNFTEFCYTFDDSKISFEESASDLAQAIFCVAFRRGSLLQLSFEKPTTNSILLFNHRNKIPGTETRTVTFGTPTDNDGINLDYIEPNAPNYPKLDTLITLYFPTNQSAVNPKKITAIGVRNQAQAMALGWRLFLKLQYQNTVTTFDATEEAALLVINDRILVADNTRSDTQDGEVLAQLVLLLTLSEKVVFDGIHNYSIFLQHPDGSVENIAITAGPSANQVILGTAPSVPCIVDPAHWARTTYQIVNDAPMRTNAFLLSEKNPKDNKVFEVKAINYDNYYGHDLDTTTPSNTYLFMPTTLGTFALQPFGVGSYGTHTVGPDYGTLTQLESHSLSFWGGRDYWEYSPAGVYGAPGSDDPTVPVRSHITGIIALIDCYQSAAFFCFGEWSLDSGTTWNGFIPGGGSVPTSEYEFLANITSALVAHFGSIALIDFTQIKFRVGITTSLNINPITPPEVYTITEVGLIILFDGATYPGGGLTGAGGGSGGGGGSVTGYLLSPATRLFQTSPTQIDMVDVTCSYLPSGPTVLFNARNWAITDPGSTPVTYYVSIYDPSKLGDASGTLTSLIGTSLGAVNDGVAGYVTIGSIIAVHNPPPIVGATETAIIGVVIDGGGAVPAIGSKKFRRVPFDGIITGWVMYSDNAGSSAQITVKNGTYTAFPTNASIVAAAQPKLVTQDKNTDTTLTGWNTVVSVDDMLEFNLDSCSSLNWVALDLIIQRG